MPHCFLHIEDGGKLIEDLEGADFVDLEAARLKAFAAARELMSASVAKGWRVEGGAIVIADDGGRTLLRVSFKDTLSDRMSLWPTA